MKKFPVEQLLKLSHIPRWSIVDMYREQSVADHSFRVAILSLEIANSIEYKDYGLLLYYALTHDAEESITGDIPSTQHKFTPVETLPEKIVSVADTVEAIIFVNRYQVSKFKGVYQYLIDRLGEKLALYFEPELFQEFLIITTDLIKVGSNYE